MRNYQQQAIEDARHYKDWIKPTHFTGEGADHYLHPNANLCDLAHEIADVDYLLDHNAWDEYLDAFVAECEKLFGLKAIYC